MTKQSPNETNKQSSLWKLQQSKKQLFKCTKDQNKFSSNLQIIHSQLSHINFDTFTSVQSIMYDIMKPLTRQITNFNPKQRTTLKLMKSVILKIFQLYCTIFVKFQHVGTLQIIKQLTMRQNFLFVKNLYKPNASAAAAAAGGVPQAVKKDILFIEDQQKQEEQKVYKWSKGRLGYTQFHKDCCESVFQKFHLLSQSLDTMKLNTIKQLLAFMYFFEDYILDQEMFKFAIRSYESLKKIVSKPSKQHLKQSTKDLFEQIAQKLIRILHYHQDRQLKRQISLLGPNLAVTILETESSIQNKLHGLRILQKFANQYFYRSSDLIKDDFFGQWLSDHNLWDLLLSKNSDSAMIHASQYILKLLVNKSKVSQQKFCQFLDLIWQSKEDIRRSYLKSIDALKLTFSFMNLALTNFRQVKQNPDLYVEDFMYLMESLARYGSDSQKKNCIDIILTVIKKHYFLWKPHFQRKSLETFKYCFQKLTDGTKQFAQRAQMYIEIVNEFISDPNYLTLSISRVILQSEQKKSSYAIQKAAKNLVQQRKIIQTIINLMSQNITFKDELMYFLKAILTKYKNYSMSASLSISQKILLQAVAYPDVFNQLINFCNIGDCQSLIKKLLKQVYEKQISFQCLKKLFYKANFAFVDVLDQQYFRRKQHRIRCDPDNLHFITDLHILVISCKFSSIQQKCAELIADIYTCFSQIYLEKGKIKTKQFMQQLVKRVQHFNVNKDFFSKAENKIQLYGTLCLLRQMLSATQIQGVGDLKAHNSLITTSMIKVKIWNNSSYGDDVQKCYQKTVPSNMTLFELLSVIGEKFKCGQHELYLQEGDNLSIPLKMNGHTLLQLGFANFKQFNAYKNPNVLIKKQSLKIDNNLNPKFLKIIKEIFQMYSRDGKMGEQQLVNYIQGVTNSPSHYRDLRVQILLKQYDSDHDGYLIQQDLIKFYQDSCENDQKQKHIWSNLQKLHYRQDLRKFNEPVSSIEEDNLLRYHVKNSQKIYELLFELCKSEDQTLKILSKNLLVRLPTCQNLVSNFLQTLTFENKSSFQISYILINVRYFLQKQQSKQNQSQQKQNQQQQKQISLDKIKQMKIQPNIKNIDKKQKYESKYMKNFIQNKNDIKIFDLIQQLSLNPNISQEQKLLLIVSINILRTILNFPSLKENYIKDQNLQIQNLHTMLQNIYILNFSQNSNFFVDLAKKCLIENQFAVFQSALALCLINNNFKWQKWIQNAIFHYQYEVRRITLNFLIFYSLKSNFSIDLFSLQIQINSGRCQQWFLLLYFYLKYNKKANIPTILESTLNTLQTQEEEISSDQYFNIILNGNLNLIQVILSVHPEVKQSQGKKIYDLLERLVQKTLSNDNRIIEYQLMALLNSMKVIQYLETLIKEVKPTDKYQIKQNFVGIKNLGSTCYMNSILQQFFTIKDFKEIITKHPLKQIPAKTNVNGIQIVDDFMYQLQKMYTYLDLSKKKYYYPKDFCLTIKDFNKKPINTSIQEDAHQFLNNLFDKVEHYMKDAGKLNDLQKIFQGKTICEISCKQCETKKQKIQDFYHLALEVKNSWTLSQSFKKFIAPQVIEGYYCQKCEKKSQQITKQTFINEAPEILIVNLQRIIFDLTTFQKVKVHSRLQFPQTLDLEQFTHTQSKTSNKKYHLKGVVIHSGTSEGGHYYSLIKVDNEWYKFNDETVSKFSFGDLQRQSFGGSQSSDGWGDNQFSTNAYILFYEVKKEETTNEVAKDGKTDEKQQKSQKDTIVSESICQQEQSIRNVNLAQIQSISTLSPQKLIASKIQTNLNSIFQWQVLQQNKNFYKQLQIHQQSFFDFVNKFYQIIRPSQFFQLNPQTQFVQQWQGLPYLEFYQKIFNLYMEIMKFFITFNGLPQKVIHETGTAIYELLTLLPQNTYNLVQKTIDEKLWAEVICSHNEIGVREIYKVVLNKIIFVYVKYYAWTYDDKINELQEINVQQSKIKVDSNQNENTILKKQQIQSQDLYQKQQSIVSQTIVTQHQVKNGYKDRILEILTYFIKAASSDLIAKNIFKSYHFFEFMQVNMQMDKQIETLCHSNNYLITLLDLLMGNEGPFANKDKKRQDFPFEVAVPLVQSILKLLCRKKNLVNFIPFKNQFINEDQYYELTSMQKQILSSNQFYKKMMKFKYDNGTLAQVVCFMSINDRKFSQKICELFLIGLNKLDQVQDAFSLLNNIKAFLIIKDDIQSDRIRWVLGIPQFQTITKLCYGLRYSNDSSNIVYVSSRYFISDQKYKPALQVLHDKKNYFTDFEIRGIITLMQILIFCEQALTYVLNIPPPSYLYYNYLTWIEEYINRIETEDHYGLSIDRKVLSQNMRTLYEQIIDRKSKILQPEYPILKKIIGTNKSIQIEEQIINEVFIIKKWGHQTYVLDNLPQQKGKQNLSLPDEIFSIKETKSYAKYFIENSDIKFCDVQVPTSKTINTLNVQTHKPLKLKFNLPNFAYQIYIQKGQMIINYPYSDFPLQGYLQIQIINEQEKLQPLKMIEPNYDAKQQEQRSKQNGVDVYDGGFQGTIGGGFDGGFDIPCQVCTYINDCKNTKCEMCDSSLR